MEMDPNIAVKRRQIIELQRQVADLRTQEGNEPNQDRKIRLLREIRDLTQAICNLEHEITAIIEGWNCNLTKALNILEKRN